MRSARRRCSERSIANQTGHQSMIVLRSYIRRANVFEENAAVAVGLATVYAEMLPDAHRPSLACAPW